ncbi:ABC transporter substrate-binding protein, partial [Klebsiella pneumoniae]
RIDTLAKLLNDPAAGAALKAEIQTQTDQLAAQAKQNKPLKVAFLLLHKGQPTSIAGGNTTASALLTLAGGINPVDQLSDYKPVSAEALIKLQPD